MLGIAMGAGSDIAIEAGGIVLVQNDLMGVVKALKLSQKTSTDQIEFVLGLDLQCGRDPDRNWCFRGLGLDAQPEN